MSDNKMRYKEAVKEIAKSILNEIDKQDNPELYIDGMIGALLGMKMAINEEKAESKRDKIINLIKEKIKS